MSSDKSPQIKIYNNLNDYAFHIEGAETYTIYNKKTQTFTEEKTFDSKDCNTYNAFMVLGLIDGKKDCYLLTAKSVKLIGHVLTAKIWKITEFDFIPQNRKNINEEDLPYIQMIQDFLPRNNLLYSEKLDLTRNIKSYKSLENNDDLSLTPFFFTKANFCWNFAMGKQFNHVQMHNILFPVINGFFGMSSVTDYHPDLEYYVIARKDVRRSGMRFLIRGADQNGNCANFAETEEVFLLTTKQNNVIENYKFCSFVSLRGSIPLIWTQEPNFQLNPTICPKQNYKENFEIFKNHMNKLFQSFDSIVCVNLIDKKKDQKSIGEYYENLSREFKEKVNNSLEYCWFDFHSECKKMRYQNLTKLLKTPNVLSFLNNNQYDFTLFDLPYNESDLVNISQYFFNFLDGNEFTKEQKNTFRINCVDCLDRCNVAQSVISRFFAHKILHELKLAEAAPVDALHPFKTVFEQNFKEIWANHGDALSICYSGTCALKGDFVRTGKRTLQGNLVDGYLSCRRFYINNLIDGYNQDCHDYFLGTINPKKVPFKNHSMSLFGIVLSVGFALTLVFYYSISGFTLSPLSQYEKEGFGRRTFRHIIFLGSLFITYFGLFSYFKKSLIDLHTKHA